MNVGTTLTKLGQLNHVRTLSDVVAEYKKRFDYQGGYMHKSDRSVGHHDPVIDVCKEAVNLEDAIKKAVASRRKDGKVFQEDSCVRISSKKEMTKKLLSSMAKLRKARTFEQVYDVVESQKVWGIGRLSMYNYAARIAAHRGIYPADYVYVHAGPLRGWKALTGCKGNVFRVAFKDLPKPLRQLPPHSVEDLLCEMRDILHPGMMA